MAGVHFISIEQAEDIKARLWDGNKTVTIAVEYGFSQATISNIKTGKQYADAKWPDGTMGGMPSYRRVQLMKSNSRDSAIQKQLGATNVPVEPGLVKATLDAFGCTPEEFYQRGLEALQQKRYDDQMAKIAKLDEKIAKMRSKLPPKRPEATPYHIDDGSSDPAKQEKFSWDEVLELVGAMPIVQVADAGEDSDLRDAIATALKLTSNTRSMWKPENQKQFLKTVNDIKQRFLNYREKLSTGNL